MAEVRISITGVKALEPLLAAVADVATQWESMTRCYSSSEENVALAELLDTLTDAARDLGGKR